MSTLDRLERIVRSWTGTLKRDRMYADTDIHMMLTDLGMQMSPETLAWATDNAALKHELEQALYAAEQKFGRAVVGQDSTLDADLNPKVHDEPERFALTLDWKGRTYVVFETVR